MFCGLVNQISVTPLSSLLNNLLSTTMPPKESLSLMDLLREDQEGRVVLAADREEVLVAPDPRSNYMANLRLNFPGKVSGRST